MRRLPAPLALALVGLTVVAAGCAGDRGAPNEPTRDVTITGPVDRAPRAPVPHLAWGPSVIDAAEALTRASALDLDVAAGQVLVASWNSPDAAGAAALVRDQHLAGVILMGGAIQSRSQVTALAQAVQDAAAEDGRSWPAIVSTDQEGGPVARLSGLVPTLPAFMAAGSSSDGASVVAAYTAQAQDMAALGFTVDWAPDADVTIGARDTAIGVRSAGSDPARAAVAVDAAVAGTVAGGVMPAIKHFPGHGSVTTDSHTGLPVQSASVAALAERDLAPFASAIRGGAPMVMLGHIEVPEWGPHPATTTPAAYDYLRGDLGFTGVAVTDAMNMEAVTGQYAPGDAEVAAMAAGADLLLMPRDPALARQAIVDAVTDGTLPRARLDEAVARVSLLMDWQRTAAERAATLAPPDADFARRAAAEWATVSSPDCGGRLVGDSVTISGGWSSERQALADALAAHGVRQGGGTTVRLLGSATGTGTADVVVAMDAPWGLGASSARTYVGLYGRSDDALRGLADVLVGAVPPGGAWAVGGMGVACASPPAP